MKIEIQTNGFSDKTKIIINGKEVNNLNSFNFSLIHPGKVKMKFSSLDRTTNSLEPHSFFGSDIQKYDSAVNFIGNVGCIGEVVTKEEVQK